MKNDHLTSSFFSGNRKNLVEKLPDNSLALISANDFMPKSADQNFPFYQNKEFYYLTGLNQERSILCLCKSHPNPNMREVLFLLNASPEMETWTGHRYTTEEASNISGIKTTLNLNDFDVLIKEFFVLSEKVFLLQNESFKYITEFSTANDLFIEKIRKQYPLHTYERLSPILGEMRLIKQKEEVQMIRHATDITETTLNKVIQSIMPGLFEYQVSANITREILWNGGQGHAFEPIVAAGKNACVLHYTTPGSILKSGELLLMDFGAEYSHYASDCSRTVPVNGRFTERQKQCYNAVLNVFKKARSLYVPGNTINGINEKVNVWMEEEMIGLGLFTKNEVAKQNPSYPLYRQYFMHGTAHFIGLDVHDAGMKHIPFQKGMILSCEPGIYIAQENLGIRIENMILVDDKPVDLMEQFPIEINEIEALMKN